jgi:RNA methyltransferase, TrmH family
MKRPFSGGGKGPPRSDRPAASRPESGRPNAARPNAGRSSVPRGKSARSAPTGVGRLSEHTADSPRTKYPKPHGQRPLHHTARGAAPRVARPGADAMQAGDKLQRIAGLPAVEALFAVAPDHIEKLYFEPAHKGALGEICVALAQARRSYRIVPGNELEKIAGTPMHGGVVALARPRPLLQFDPVAAAAWAADREVILILDGVGNPHNLGAIARTAAFLGVRRLVLSRHAGQALPSDSSYRVAKGGLDRMEIYVADALPAALNRLKKSYHVIGTALSQAEPLSKLRRDGRPAAIVLGNEEDGLPPATLAACETVVTIEGPGLMQSMNVAVTAAILMHALR